ncbi:MAG: peptidase U32 family protein [Bacteroidia bacterium]|nr:peptidase U32 family protein [Bacteroidia bacterium]
MDRNELEIMAPAGNFECLMAAIQGGANSVYFGVGHLNMRSHSANNFSISDLPEVVRICSEYGVKTYLTLNIVLYPEDLEEAHSTLDAAKAAGVSAVIASDMAAIMYCRQIGMEVHISTQLSISNADALRFYAQFADVIVLARELRLDQVRTIYDTIIDEHITGPSGELVRIEMFAHGALCMAISGKCYLSLHSYGASANRGACFQVCRRGYEVTDVETGNQLNIDNKYIMSPKDLCTIEFMDRIIEAGVKVFKIEGRARSAEYVKKCASCYRRAADAVCEGQYTPEVAGTLKAELSQVFNRGFWDGYYQGAYLGQWSDVYGSSATRKKVYCGKVTNWFDRIGVAEILVESATLKQGANAMAIGATTGVVEFTVDDMRVDFNTVEAAGKGTRCSVAIKPDAILKADGTPAEETVKFDRLHRGDKIYIWEDNQAYL